MEIIAVIRTDFPEKFGIPRQSGLVDTQGVIEFLPAFRDVSAVRGLDGFSHIWLLWKFSENAKDGWSPTVRPPRLGGNKRMGVFATRSPFRPNPIGLSCVKLEKIDVDGDNAPRLLVSGADLMDGTPIYDIKPYLPHADCVPEATGGFSAPLTAYRLKVDIPAHLKCEKREELIKILEQDPRPSYHNDSRDYGMSFAGYAVKFHVEDDTLFVTEIKQEKTKHFSTN